MDNKFYFRAPALLLMMFAAHTTAAHASENESTDLPTDDSSYQPPTTLDQVEPNLSETRSAHPYNVVKSVNAADLSNIQTAPEKLDTASIEPIETVPNEHEATVTAPTTKDTQSEEISSKEPLSSDEPSADKVTTDKQPVAVTTDDSLNSNVNTTKEPIKTAVPENNISSTTNSSAETPKPVTEAAVTDDQRQKSAETVKPLSSTETTTAASKAVVRPKLTLRSTKATTLTSTVKKTSSDMSVNDYIKYKNYEVPKYEEDFSTNIPKIAYRAGVGAPEGIIAHETANNTSTIDGEIAYMKRNYQNAFVHAFVDDNRIVETAPTDYLAWGAGPYANSRFIQVELVRVQGKDRFSKAINNYADYIATNLLYYKLPVDSAEYDGTGTLWSHKAISNYIGGTDHTDPYGWFAENNYTFDELVYLVAEKYNYKTSGIPATTPAPPTTPAPAPVKTGQITTTAVSKMVRIKSKSSPVYSSVSDVNSQEANSKYGVSYYVNKKAVLNGVTYYSLQDNEKVSRGWVEAKYLTQATRSAEKKITTKYTINSKVSGIYSVPWGTSAQKINDLKSSINKSFSPSKKVTINNTPYYFGTINKMTGWISGSHLTLNVGPTQLKTVDMIGRTSSKGATYYTDSKISKKAAKKLVNMQYYIDKQGMKGSTKYFRIVDSANKMVGWVSDSGIKQTSHKVVNYQKAPYVINNTKTYVYHIPGGSASQRVAPLTHLTSKVFNVVKAEQVGSALWYKGTIANTRTIGWIAGKYLTKQTIKTKKAPDSLSSAVKKQMKLKNSKPQVSYIKSNGTHAWRNATTAEVKRAMNTNNTMNDSVQKYQFLDLHSSQGISGSQLNKLLVGKGVLEGQGDAFAKAAKTLNINEIYLISHALLETGNGTSALSTGLGYNRKTGKVTTKSSVKYYNMFGTKATDKNVENGGIKYAYEQGWNTPAKAIVGGAKYVADSYFKNQQVTLHQMRWNPVNTGSHQYATDINWASKNASRIAQFYQQLGLEGLKYFIHRYDQ